MARTVSIDSRKDPVIKMKLTEVTGEAVGAGVNLKQVAGSETSFTTPEISPVPNST